MSLSLSNFAVWHVAVPYLVQAFGPGDGDSIPGGRRDQADLRLSRIGTVPLPVEVHLPAQLAVPPRILAGHVVNGIRGTRIDWWRLLSGVD